MTEYERARAWMNKRNLSADQLAELTGYGRRSVYWMLLGQSPPNATRRKPAKVAPWVFQRFRMACAGVEAQLNSGKNFDWES